ncbi:MAG: helix-turn-helix domain-containing protein [Pseudonocardiaceae bacterium]
MTPSFLVAVFCPTRLRAYRHLRGWDRAGLATAAGTTVETIATIETGRASPCPGLVTGLTEALGCPPGALHSTSDPVDNAGYWEVICAALPPLNGNQIATLGIVLRRIHSATRHPAPADATGQRRAA